MQSDLNPSDKLLDVMTVADMCVDLVMMGNVRPEFHQVEQIVDDYSLEVGGSANIFASQLVKLGARAGVLGWVGRDAFGAFVLQKLQVMGLDTSGVNVHPRLKTGLGVALAEPTDRAILTYLGTIDATQPADLKDELLASCRHWHIASYFLLGNLRALWPAWLSKCKDAGLTTSLDTNWDPENRWESVTDLLPYVDVFLPNEAEALSITGENEVLDAAKWLSGRVPFVVVKRGDKGAVAMRGDSMWEIHPVDGPPTVVDSIGAGDNFDAGFIRAWLLGREINQCLALGHRCAVSSLAEQGGIRGQLCEVV